MDEEISGAVTGFIPLNDRIAMISIQINYRKMNIVQVYTPIGEKPNDMIEEFYTDLQELIEVTEKKTLQLLQATLMSKLQL